MLLGLVEQDTELKKVSKKEWHGPCPICRGRDRFRVQPEKGKTGKFACRQCGIEGDVIDYLRKVRGMSFLEARDFAGETYSFETKTIKTDFSWQTEKKIVVSPRIAHSKPTPPKNPTPSTENPENPPETTESVEVKQDIPLVDETAQGQTEETFEPVIDREEVSVETPVIRGKVDVVIATTPENGWCAKGQTYCQDFRYNRRFRVEKCRFESKDPVGTTIDLLAQCPNSNILEGIINEQRGRELYSKDNSDNSPCLDRLQDFDSHAKKLHGESLETDGRGYKNLLGIYCHAEDSGSGMKYQKNPSGPSFQLIMQNMIQFGCADCKDRHGQVCAGGSYPQLIGLLKSCLNK